MISPINAWKSFGRNAFVFEGRSSRAAFWWVILGLILAGSLIYLVFDSLILGNGFYSENFYEIKSYTFTFVFGITLLLPLLSLTVRRFHDAGISPLILAAILLIPLSIAITMELISRSNGNLYNITSNTNLFLSILDLVNNYSPLLILLTIITICMMPSRFSRYLKYPMDSY